MFLGRHVVPASARPLLSHLPWHELSSDVRVRWAVPWRARLVEAPDGPRVAVYICRKGYMAPEARGCAPGSEGARTSQIQHLPISSPNVLGGLRVELQSFSSAIECSITEAWLNAPAEAPKGYTPMMTMMMLEEKDN